MWGKIAPPGRAALLRCTWLVFERAAAAEGSEDFAVVASGESEGEDEAHWSAMLTHFDADKVRLMALMTTGTHLTVCANQTAPATLPPARRQRSSPRARAVQGVYGPEVLDVRADPRCARGIDGAWRARLPRPACRHVSPCCARCGMATTACCPSERCAFLLPRPSNFTRECPPSPL